MIGKEYSVGDVIWFIPRGYLIAIQCKIIELDDYFRKKDPQAYLFYDIDEPVGHSIADDEIIDIKEEAIETLKNLDLSSEGISSGAITLEEYRKRKIDFVVGTWGHLSPEEKESEKTDWYKTLPIKEKNVEWFNLESCPTD